jgi:hypothetical protein
LKLSTFAPSASPRLRQHRLHHVAVHIGEAVVAALELVGEALVVNAGEVQHRRLEIVDVDFVLDGVVFSLSAANGESPTPPSPIGWERGWG